MPTLLECMDRSRREAGAMLWLCRPAALPRVHAIRPLHRSVCVRGGGGEINFNEDTYTGSNFAKTSPIGCREPHC